MCSLIIPAHNESAVIGRLLERLLITRGAAHAQIVVVANGCTDDTAAVARRLGMNVTVLETPTPSKANALNLGDAAAAGFPRIFIDADVLLGAAEIKKLVARLAKGDVLAVAPKAKFDLTGCSRAVRAYYRIYLRLPSAKDGIGGSGVYALSEAGRRRFGKFPNITSDDGFVRFHFAPHERAVVDDCYSIVFAPKTLRELIAIKTRSHFGTLELKRDFPELYRAHGPGRRSILIGLLGKVWLWPSLAVYCYVKLVARGRAARRIRLNQNAIWERDETSRKRPPVSPAEAAS